MLSENLKFCVMLYQAMSVAATGMACILQTNKEFYSCGNNFQHCCLLFLYNSVLSLVNYIFNP